MWISIFLVMKLTCFFNVPQNIFLVECSMKNFITFAYGVAQKNLEFIFFIEFSWNYVWLQGKKKSCDCLTRLDYGKNFECILDVHLAIDLWEQFLNFNPCPLKWKIFWRHHISTNRSQNLGNSNVITLRFFSSTVRW